MATTPMSAAPAIRQPKAPKPPKPMTVAERNRLATQGIVSAFADADEKWAATAAITAALEAVHERFRWDASLRQQISEKYGELAVLSKPKPKVDRGPAPTPKPASRKAQHSPLTKTNPYELANEWGRDHLRALLEGASQTLLREAVAVVHEHNPMSKLPNRSKNADMVDYIMEHVAGSGS